MFYSDLLGSNPTTITRWHNEMAPDLRPEGNDDGRWDFFKCSLFFFFTLVSFLLYCNYYLQFTSVDVYGMRSDNKEASATKDDERRPEAQMRLGAQTLF